MVFAPALARIRSLLFGYFETGPYLSVGGSLFWIEIVFMVAISVRFARGASKLRSFLNLFNIEEPKSNEANLPVDLE
jgi:hypothetical protein